MDKVAVILTTGDLQSLENMLSTVNPKEIVSPGGMNHWALAQARILSAMNKAEPWLPPAEPKPD